jgi:hypothetical protein
MNGHRKTTANESEKKEKKKVDHVTVEGEYTTAAGPTGTSGTVKTTESELISIIVQTTPPKLSS